MKALVISKPKNMVAIAAALGILTLVSTSNANAHVVKFVPEAVCSTIATNMPLPTYVCCKLYDGQHKQYVFRNMWVSGSCQNVNANARFDMGCKPTSLVYGTGSTIPPIATFCQFSYSAIKHHNEILF